MTWLEGTIPRRGEGRAGKKRGVSSVMKILCQVGVIFGVCWVSQVLESLLPFAFPASVIGMVLLFLLLAVRVLRVEHIQAKSDFLLANMAFFFLPAGVSILNYLEELRSAAVALVVICLVTTVLVFGATALSIKLTLRLMGRGKGHD